MNPNALSARKYIVFELKKSIRQDKTKELTHFAGSYILSASGNAAPAWRLHVTAGFYVLDALKSIMTRVCSQNEPAF